MVTERSDTSEPNNNYFRTIDWDFCLMSIGVRDWGWFLVIVFIWQHLISFRDYQYHWDTEWKSKTKNTANKIIIYQNWLTSVLTDYNINDRCVKQVRERNRSSITLRIDHHCETTGRDELFSRCQTKCLFVFLHSTTEINSKSINWNKIKRYWAEKKQLIFGPFFPFQPVPGYLIIISIILNIFHCQIIALFLYSSNETIVVSNLVLLMTKTGLTHLKTIQKHSAWQCTNILIYRWRLRRSKISHLKYKK